MNSKSIYIDLLKVYFCLVILAYHMGFLEGGYLAVCSFFVISGYLSANEFNKDNFSVLQYYKKRFFRVYVPMFLVTMCSLALCTILLKEVSWICMKQEVTSILFCYNNFWQLSANLDYFARHVDSPFMHLWYVSILIQLEIVFPVVLFVVKWIYEKTNRYIAVVFIGIIAVGSLSYFFISYEDKGLMYTYYNTYTRCFSWLVGIGVGLIAEKQSDKQTSYTRPKCIISSVFFVLILIVQSLIFAVGGSKSDYFCEYMLTSTLFAGGLLLLSKYLENSKKCHEESNIENKAQLEGTTYEKKQYLPVRQIADISYELFLVQYPVIYMFQYCNIDRSIKTVLNLLVVFLFTFALHTVCTIKKNELCGFMQNFIKYLLTYVVLIGMIYGGYIFTTSKDLQAEMERLEMELAMQEAEQEKRQQEYEALMIAKAEEEKRREEERERVEHDKEISDLDWEINELQNQMDNIDLKVKNEPIVFVGDSVLLGASTKLYEDFPYCYVDAKISRTAYVINPIFVSLKESGTLGEIVVINCGANGDCPNYIKDEIMETLSEQQVFWFTTTNSKTANQTLRDYAEGYENLHVIDWEVISEGHPEYFAGDGIHLQQVGTEAYSEAVKEAIAEYILEPMEEEMNDLLEKKDSLK